VGGVVVSDAATFTVDPERARLVPSIDDLVDELVRARQVELAAIRRFDRAIATPDELPALGACVEAAKRRALAVDALTVAS
jgi:hypothetical protein